MITDLICVPQWLLIALLFSGFMLGYWGDIFFSKEKDEP